jgi:hypothetical protein
MGGERADGASLLEVSDGTTSQGAGDLETIRHHRRGDELVASHVREHGVVLGLGEHHRLGNLLLYLALGPLLLGGLSLHLGRLLGVDLLLRSFSLRMKRDTQRNTRMSEITCTCGDDKKIG